MVTNLHSEESPSGKIFTCVECDAPHDAENLFVLPMNELAKIKGEDDGPENAFITPDDLPDFAVCAECRDPEEVFTLAASIVSSQRYHKRRTRVHNFNRSQPNGLVTKAELGELVSCYGCAESGKKTLILRRDAKCPGWVGCNILKGRKLHEKNMQSPHKNSRLYVTSEDLLKSGKEGYVLCDPCMGAAIPVLKKKGRELGVPGHFIAKKIKAQPLVVMLKGVRRVGK